MLAKAGGRRYACHMSICYVDTPVGRLALEADHDAVTGVRWASPGERSRDKTTSPVLKEATRQLDRYFSGKLRRFDLPLAARGTPFQERTWTALRAIPFGERRSYAALAAAIGAPRAVRAVGGANGRNPLSIVVPCHRVIGSDGSLTGYGGGEERKRWLLAHELRIAGRA